MMPQEQAGSKMRRTACGKKSHPFYAGVKGPYAKVANIVIAGLQVYKPGLGTQAKLIRMA